MTEHSTLCELASLYVLDALDRSDAGVFERHLSEGCHICSAEVDGLRFAARSLAFAAAPAEPSPALRDRVLGSVRESAAAPAVAGRERLDFEEQGRWKPYSAPGIEYRLLHFDKADRNVVVLVRAQPGAQYPIHGHSAQEQMFMLRGDLTLDGTTYRAGDFIHSEKGSSHGAADTTKGCMFLMRGSIDDLVLSTGEAQAGQHASSI